MTLAQSLSKQFYEKHYYTESLSTAAVRDIIQQAKQDSAMAVSHEEVHFMFNTWKKSRGELVPPHGEGDVE